MPKQNNDSKRAHVRNPPTRSQVQSGKEICHSSATDRWGAAELPAMHALHSSETVVARASYSVQPCRYGRLMNGSASGQPTALRFSASHWSFRPER